VLVLLFATEATEITEAYGFSSVSSVLFANSLRLVPQCSGGTVARKLVLPLPMLYRGKIRTIREEKV
jgi:hypothetical protein